MSIPPGPSSALVPRSLRVQLIHHVENSTLDVQVTSSTTIFPESKQGSPSTIPLSIIDSTVSYFARCAAIWFYDPPSSPKAAISSAHLQAALSKTLNAYPQWCGRLSYTAHKANAGHNERYRRVHLTFNDSTDLGVSFITATSPKILSDFLPDTASRKSGKKAWDGFELPTDGLYPSVPLSLDSDNTPPDAPNLVVQSTTFACGSTAVAIAITHSLADAQTLSQFSNDFSKVSRAILNSEPMPHLSPIFDPQRLDAFAAGDIDAETPDPALLEKARKLPCHRYDNYLHVPNQPWPVHSPPDLDTVSHLPLSPTDPLPWDEYDAKAPVSHRILHFSASEIQYIYTKVTSSKEAAEMSKLDALLAHIWTRINAARNLEPGTITYLDMTLGLRPRIVPPLPNNFLGSPIMNAAIPTTTPTSSTPPSLAAVASTIRNTLKAFTPESIAAQLHDLAFEVSPQRIWRCFLGKKHIILTTWLYLGLDKVDFVGEKGGKVRYVWPIMPAVDGLVDVVETMGEKGDKSGHWSRNGVDVSVYLEESAMERLLRDEALWGAQPRSQILSIYQLIPFTLFFSPPISFRLVFFPESATASVRLSFSSKLNVLLGGNLGILWQAVREHVYNLLAALGLRVDGPKQEDRVNDQLPTERDAEEPKAESAVVRRGTKLSKVDAGGGSPEEGDDHVEYSQFLGEQGLGPLVDDDGVGEAEVLYHECLPWHQGADPEEVVERLRDLGVAFGPHKGPQAGRCGAELQLLHDIVQVRHAPHLAGDGSTEWHVEEARERDHRGSNTDSVRVVLVMLGCLLGRPPRLHRGQEVGSGKSQKEEQGREDAAGGAVVLEGMWGHEARLCKGDPHVLHSGWTMQRHDGAVMG
ncbi:Anthranilate N-benzoyltransferase protein [Lachnellula occidentalis]|uniref:Anthranilate N-benzoyltransferase protein n=1 Tax=Lachnellula occidentalis TaxID=215460 RepID=A0A8H8RUX8_9HELO|nr:Anthranilate N-benzoyltransferase protein [Lachnellula occidentalis]